MSHTCEWIMSHMWMNHGTHVNESWHTCTTTTKPIASNISVMSHMWMRHVTHINESCHTYEWVMSDKWIMSRMYCHCITNCHQYPHEFVQPFAECMHMHNMTYMSHLWMNHVTCKRQWINHVTHVHVLPHHYQLPATSPWIRAALCGAYAQAWLALYVTLVNESCHICTQMNHVTCTREWIMSHIYMYYHTITNCQQHLHEFVQPFAFAGRIQMRDMTYSHIWHDSFTSVTCLIHTCDISLNLPLCLSLSPPPPPHQLPARLPWVRAALCSGAARRNTLTALANSSWPTYLTTVYVFIYIYIHIHIYKKN